MSAATPARTIDLAEPDSAWAELLNAIDLLAAEDRFEVRVTGLDGGGPAGDRVGQIIARGYSAGPREAADGAVLAPSPAGVLFVVSDLGGAARPPEWLAGLPPESFRQYLLAVDMSAENFAALSSEFPGESWHLDEFLAEGSLAEFVMEFMASRQIDLVHVVNSRLGFDLLPFIRTSYPRTRVTADVGSRGAYDQVLMTYVTTRYGNVVDGFCASTSETADQLAATYISSSRVVLMPPVEGTSGPAAVAQAHQSVFGRLLAALIA
jgi:hypothetical protein